ncbi:MAG: class I SAM-dependent methyltransferase [Anaerolineae bacterium]
MSEFLEVTDEEIEEIMPILQRLIWASPETRKKVQQMGVNLLPVDYYSNTPSIEEIEESFEYTAGEPPYLNLHIFNSQRFKQTLDRLIVYSNEFNPPIVGDPINCENYFWQNEMFSHSDAMAYYCFIRYLKPANILEIGSGFSTLVALEAVGKNKSGNVHCIEPYPREFLKKNAAVDLHSIKVQDVKAEFINDTLKDGDILFIDSTHTVKSGSDCLHIYLRLLPEVRRNIHVHAHDIHLPFGLRQDWLLNHQRFWTEQYLLLAFLIDNPKASLLYGSMYNGTWLPKRMKTFMGNKYPYGGGSVWFSYNGALNA